jgi:hypothetical protein
MASGIPFNADARMAAAIRKSFLLLFFKKEVLPSISDPAA